MAVCVALSPSAFATTIDFSCSDGSGTGILYPSGTSTMALCNGSSLSTNSPSTLVTWTQSGYLVAPHSGTVVYNPNQGNSAPGITDLSNGATIEITNGGSFFFDSVDIKGASLSGYNIIGYNGATGVLDESCSGSCGGTSGWETILAGSKSDIKLTSLYISLDGSGSLYLDNIGVVTPEPGSLVLLGSGILAFAFFIRRKLTV
jgi:hypothetical protein